ncbi:hypothetical protein BDM02DRAFT_2984008 [Thelephora ganbajun]|uniref:Uncharacterized protein n=1 Tax=Thelephora ganbajun TaxID=370292 RepID=A0ACB6ZBY0_THEGA|nr:hypothetical protein BDM02DRAFT_2984008 [Thelephora ganbajun]
MQLRIVRLWLPCIFLLFLITQANAVRLDQCRARLANGTDQSGPLKITYSQCVDKCGGGAGEFRWTMFSQGFNAWLLPWIALIFQLPFGATDRVDNLVSVLVAIGSPALAGYSLAVTRLNSRWLSRQFLHLNFPNKANIPLAVSSLQHIPFRINTSGSLLPSLIVLPQNDRYWRLLGVAAKRTRQWTIPVAMNIVWVLFAFLLTLVDSFVDFNNFITVPGDAGYSIVSVWTYLLPLVVGWLHVGSQPEPTHLHEALDGAHDVAYVATASEPVLATRITGRSTRAIENSTRHIDHVNADEKKSAPIFNYARVFVWSQNAEHILRLYEHAAAKADQRITVQRGGEWLSNDDDTILAHDRTGNEEEVMQYCTEEPEVPVSPNPKYGSPQFRTPLATCSAFPPSPEPSATGTYPNPDAFAHGRIPSTLSKYDEEAPSSEVRAVPEKPVFATEVFQRVIFATVLALCLQWSTTGAAILIHLNTPPKGIGCRSLTFVVYGAAATVAFWLLLLSSALAHLARRQSIRERRSGLKTFIGYIATLTRWLGKFIAIANGFGILISCIMQFAGVYDNCFCSSTVFGGDPNGFVWFIDADVKGSQVYKYWIGGVAMAFGASGLYTFAIYVATPMG